MGASIVERKLRRPVRYLVSLYDILEAALRCRGPRETDEGNPCPPPDNLTSPPAANERWCCASLKLRHLGWPRARGNRDSASSLGPASRDGMCDIEMSNYE